MAPGTAVALLRSFETLGGWSFDVGAELVVVAVYPDQGRVGGDFLSLSLPVTGERVLQGVRPGDVRVLALAKEGSA
jgi:hypothetical protein